MTDTPMTCARLEELLATSLDDVLGRDSPDWRAAMDAHLAACPSCPALLADTRAIRAAARRLGPIEPPPQVWLGIERAIGVQPGARTSRKVWGWQALAAAAVLALVASGLGWVASRLDRSSGALETLRTGAAPDEAHDLTGFTLAEAQYTDAIARLEEATAAADSRALDAATSATLRSSLDEVDFAIGDARDALTRQPDDELSQESLLDALGSKVALLQDTVALLGEAGARAEERNP
jgi:hypothetical protein